MKHIQCPAVYEPITDAQSTSVFIAGGITGTGDWQQTAVELFGQLSKPFEHRLQDTYLLNPRRESFDITNPSMSDFQITWEHDHLEKADACLFWFTPETMCPITLYELGKWSMTHRPLFVGCHPDYQRKFDVIKQTSLIRPDVCVRQNLEHVVQDAVNYLLDGSHVVVRFTTYDHFELAVRRMVDNPQLYQTDSELLTDSEYYVEEDESNGVIICFRCYAPVMSYLPFPIASMAETIIDITHRTVLKSRFPDTTFNSILERCTRQTLPKPIYHRHRVN